MTCVFSPSAHCLKNLLLEEEFVSIPIVQVGMVQAIKKYFNSRKQSCVIFDYHEYSTEAM